MDNPTALQTGQHDKTDIKNGRQTQPRGPGPGKPKIQVHTNMSGDRPKDAPPIDLTAAEPLTPEDFAALVKRWKPRATVTVPDHIFQGGPFTATVTLDVPPDRLPAHIARQLPNVRTALALLEEVRALKRRLGRDRELRRRIETLLGDVKRLLALHGELSAPTAP